MTHSSAPTVRPDLPLFINRLPENIRRAVLARASVRAYRAGETICAQGAPADAIYFVVSGAVHLVQPGMSIPLDIGESFGESEVLRGANYDAALVAVSGAQLWVLEKDALDALLEKHGALALALTQHLVQKLERQSWSPPVAPQPRRTRGTNRQIRPLAMAAMLVALIVGIGLSAVTLLFWATTLNVDALDVNAPQPLSSEERGKGVRSAPTKVAQAVKLAEPTPTAKPATTTHTVGSGDTLSAIAIMHGTNPGNVRALNSLASDVIRVGDQLSVPGGIVVIVPTRTPRPQPTAASPQPTAAPAAPPPTALAPVALAGPPAPTPVALVWKMPAWTSVESANVPAGQKYWRLAKAIYFDEASAGGRVNILVATVDEEGKQMADVSVKMEWGGGEYTTRKTESKRDPFLLPYDLDIIAAHDMAGGSSFSPERGERGGYTITAEGLPSDIVSGMGLPLRHHVAFLLVFQRSTK